jgi:hypothetical protein
VRVERFHIHQQCVGGALSLFRSSAALSISHPSVVCSRIYTSCGLCSLSLSSLSPLYSSAIFSHPSAFGGAYSRIHQQWVVHALKHIPQQRLFVVTVRGECAFDWAFAWATFAFIVDRNCDVGWMLSRSMLPIGRSTGRSTGCSTGRSTGRSIGRSGGRSGGRSIERSIERSHSL